jgi:preprotein translocase subunit SecA
MRLFGSEKVAKVMDRMGLRRRRSNSAFDDDKISNAHRKKVEENNFGVRKRLLEYDDVMNAQREVIYKRRRHALFGERLKLDIANMLYDTCELIIHTKELMISKL